MLVAVTDETLRAAADARRNIRRVTDKQAVALVTAWVNAWDTLQPLFAEAVAELIAGGETVPRAVVARNRKLRSAIEQARATLDAMITEMNQVISKDLMEVLLDAVNSHQAVITTQLPPGTAGLSINLDAPAPEALNAMVTRTTQQIHSATKPLTAWTIRHMKNELVRGIVVGDNPREVARKIMKVTERQFNGGLGRAMTIARTEMLSAHRAGTLESAKHNTDLLTGWRWQCTLDRRTCPACLAKHGTLHAVDAYGPEGHPNCHCARVDVTKSWADLGFPDIEEPADSFPDARAWFDNLTDDSKLAIMGPTRLQLLNDGSIGWDNLATKRHSAGWMDHYVQTPVKDLVAQAKLLAEMVE